MISEGALGLLDALDKFEMNQGTRFLTFANFSIRGKMLRYLGRSSFNYAFTVPAEIAKIANSIKKYSEEWEDKHKCTPSRSQILNHFKIDDYTLSYYYILIGAKSFSLDQGAFDNEQNETCDIEDVNVISASFSIEKKESKNILEKIIFNLPLKQKLVIIKRFGLDNGERQNLESIGEQLALTKQRVAQIEKEALDTIRKEIKKSELNIKCLQ